MNVETTGPALSQEWNMRNQEVVDVTRPNAFIRLGAMDVTKPYDLIEVWGHRASSAAGFVLRFTHTKRDYYLCLFCFVLSVLFYF